MKNTRIILAVTNDLTYDRRMYRICSALAEEGAAITLVGRKLKSSSPYHPEKHEGVRLRCWFNKGLLFYKEYNFRLFLFLLTHKFDIACACDLDTALAIRGAAGLKGKKTVYDAHEYFTEVPEIVHRPIIRAVWKFIARITIPGFNARYTVGEELAILMGKKYNVAFDVIRNIEPANQASPPITERKKILLYQGALNAGRGLESCIKAMMHLQDWHLLLAGEGDITSSLKELVHTLQLEDRVKFLGWVFPKDLPALMQQAKLSINLREQSSPNDYYSLPNKFFDAIHAGLPSINMKYPEYVRIVEKFPCAYLIETVSEAAIVDAIHHFESNPKAWAAMSEACLEAAKEYTWAKESEKLKQIYLELLD